MSVFQILELFADFILGFKNPTKEDSINPEDTSNAGFTLEIHDLYSNA